MGFKIKVVRGDITLFECYPLENNSGIDFYECAEEPCYKAVLDLLKWHGIEKFGGMVNEGKLGQEILEVTFASGDTLIITGPFENYGTIRLRRLIRELFQ